VFDLGVHSVDYSVIISGNFIVFNPLPYLNTKAQPKAAEKA